MIEQISNRQAYVACSLVWLSLMAIVAVAYMGRLELWGVIGCAISAATAYALTGEDAANKREMRNSQGAPADLPSRNIVRRK